MLEEVGVRRGCVGGISIREVCVREVCVSGVGVRGIGGLNLVTEGCFLMVIFSRWQCVVCM